MRVDGHCGHERQRRRRRRCERRRGRVCFLLSVFLLLMLSLFAPSPVVVVVSSVAVRDPRRGRRRPAGRLAPSARAGRAGHRGEARRVRDGLGGMEPAGVAVELGGIAAAGAGVVFRGDDVGDRGPRQVVGRGRARRRLHGCDGLRLWSPCSLAAAVARRPGAGKRGTLSSAAFLFGRSNQSAEEEEMLSLFFPSSPRRQRCC